MFIDLGAPTKYVYNWEKAEELSEEEENPEVFCVKHVFEVGSFTRRQRRAGGCLSPRLELACCFGFPALLVVPGFLVVLAWQTYADMAESYRRRLRG